MLVTSVEIEAFRHITNKQTMAVDPETPSAYRSRGWSGRTGFLIG